MVQGINTAPRSFATSAAETGPAELSLHGSMNQTAERMSSHCSDLAEINGRLEKFIALTIGPRPQPGEPERAATREPSTLTGTMGALADGIERQLRMLRNNLAALGA